MGTAHGLSGLIHLTEFLRSRGPGIVGVCGGVRRGLVWGSPRDTKRAALGRKDVSRL